MPSSSETLTAERILEATEEVLRRHGPAKATVVDVARALGVSHGSVYRHFGTKAELRAAVTKRWLDRTTDALAGIVDGAEATEPKLRHWLTELFTVKRRKVADDPELFATYTALTEEHSAAVDQHIADLTGQLARILAEFPLDAAAVDALARSVFDATDRFHHPAHATDWQRPGIDEEFEAVVELVIRGLKSSELS